MTNINRTVNFHMESFFFFLTPHFAFTILEVEILSQYFFIIYLIFKILFQLI